MQVVKRTLNWFQKVPPHTQLKAQQAKRLAVAKAFISTQQAIAYTISDQQSAAVAAQGDLIARVAAKRLNRTL